MRTLRRIVALSDTHGNTQQFDYLIHHNIQGDLFVHAGDFTKYNRQDGLQSFFSKMDRLKFRHKIVIAGNHEIALDQKMDADNKKKIQEKFPCLVTRSIYLANSRRNPIKTEKKLYLSLASKHLNRRSQNIRNALLPLTSSLERRLPI